MSRKLLFVVNSPDFFLSHRLHLALAARHSGYDVNVATMDGVSTNDIRAEGFSHHIIPLSRSGKNLVSEIVCLMAIFRLFRRLRPDVVHLVTVKPVLYGGIAARLTGVRGVVASVSGLGFVFIAKGFKAKVVRVLVLSLYKLAFGHTNLKVIFQNADDQKVLLRHGAIKESSAVMIRGSGVDLRAYRARPEPEGLPVVTMASRLLKDKGVFEFVEAARILKRQGITVRFQLVGEPDADNPASLTQADLQSWKDEGAVNLLGFRKDIADIFSMSHLVVLPSYREGLPKVLIEAAACGRAVVTTDVPGCRDAIEPDRTGLLVPVRDALALAKAIKRLLDDAALRHDMGQAGRQLAEQAFDINKVVGAHLDIYRSLERPLGSPR